MAEERKLFTVCVSGTRENVPQLNNILEKKLLKLHHEYKDNLFLVMGDCSGVDAFVLQFCQDYAIPFKKFVANWTKYGNSAGPLRNGLMLDTKPNILMCFHTDRSLHRGTRNCYNQAKSRRIPTEVYIVEISKDTNSSILLSIDQNGKETTESL